MTFKDLKLVEPILKAIDETGYVSPTPIQEQAIPYILQYKDLFGVAQTGTGKTAAFALPLIQNLLKSNQSGEKRIKVLVLSPTRELAIQTRDNFRDYGKYTNIKCSVILGGVNQNSQIEVLKKGVDVLVATPGRLLDLINQKYAKLGSVEVLVLDEADTMLDMGFIQDVKKIIAQIPANRQTLLFSATMPSEINKLAETFLKNPVTVKVNAVSTTVEKVKQSVYYVDKSNKTKLLMNILKDEGIKSALIFTRTKHGANKLSDTLIANGVTCEVIHGNKSQNARVTALTNFKSGKSRVLVATDIAARGIDIIELSHVINFEIPNIAETYVHRVGRTARAGLGGVAISLVDIDEKAFLKDIQKLIKQEIFIVEGHDYPMTNMTLSPKEVQRGRGSNRSFSKQNSPKPFRNDNNKPNRSSNHSSRNKFSKRTPQKH